MKNKSDFSASTQGTQARYRVPLVSFAALLCQCLAGATISKADSISFSAVDGLINGGSGTAGDFNATHLISLLGSDTGCLRNGIDSCSFSYRITGQASADSALFSVADLASLSGSATFNFNLLDTALWNIQAVISYVGVVGVNDAGPAYASQLNVTSFGSATGIAFALPGATQSATSAVNQSFFSSSLSDTVLNVVPGAGSVSVSLNLSCASGDSNDGECLSSIGSFSSLSSFDLDNTLNAVNSFNDDGVIVTITMMPHLNFSGQILNSNLALTAGEALTGYGMVSGGVSGTGGTISASGSGLTLGNAADVNGFNFGGTLNVNNSSVILKDANFADLGTSTTLSGGTLTAANGVNLGSSSTLSGFGSVNAKVSGAAGSTITASGSSLTLGNSTDPAGFSFDGTLNVGGSMVTLQSTSVANLGTQTVLAGGVLKAVNGMSIDGSDTISGYGVIFGNVSGSNANAGLLIANPTGDVVLAGNLIVGNSPVAIYSQHSADLGTSTTLSGGTLTAANGVSLGSSSTLSGFGSVNAKVSGAAGSIITASGSGLMLGNSTDPAGFSFDGTLNVGISTVTLQDGNLADLGVSTVLQGGKLIAANGITLDGTDTITGYGLIFGAIAADNLSSRLIASNTLTLSAPLNVGADMVTVLTLGKISLQGVTSFLGGELRSTGIIEIASDASIAGHGMVAGNVAGLSGSAIAAQGGNLALGDSSSFDGFRTAGSIAVGAQTVTLSSRGFATLGTQTTLAGGTLAAANGVFLAGGNAVSGHGQIDGRIAAGMGSTIVATGNLSLGDANAFDGYFSDGVLDTGSNVVTINDRNQAVLGSLTSLAGGQMDAPNGLLLNPGRNLVGFGLVTANLRNDGSVFGLGPQLPDGLVFTGDVSGTGDFSGNVTFSGSYSPGHSPASVNLENFLLTDGSKLFIEIGGLMAGSAYDQLNASGTASLNGTLNVSLLNLGSGLFMPHAGDSFDILTANTIQGSFSSLSFAALTDPNLTWHIDYLTDAIGPTDIVRLSVQAVPEPEAYVMMLAGLGLVGWASRRRRA